MAPLPTMMMLFGFSGQCHGFAVADHLFAVLFEVGEFAAAGAGGDDDMFAFHDLGFAVGTGHFNLSFCL
jgi:hypothetical protein